MSWMRFLHRRRSDLELQIEIETFLREESADNEARGMGYLEAWLRGIGCVPLFNLMEDAATAEISSAQLWQWVHHNAKLSDGRAVDLALVESMISNELERQKSP